MSAKPYRPKLGDKFPYAIHERNKDIRRLPLCPTDKLVLRTMNDHTNVAADNMRASSDTLANETGFTRRTVCEAVARLKHAGAVKEVGKSFRGVRIYALTLPEFSVEKYTDALQSTTSRKSKRVRAVQPARARIESSACAQSDERVRAATCDRRAHKPNSEPNLRTDDLNPIEEPFQTEFLGIGTEVKKPFGGAKNAPPASEPVKDEDQNLTTRLPDEVVQVIDGMKITADDIRRLFANA